MIQQIMICWYLLFDLEIAADFFQGVDVHQGTLQIFSSFYNQLSCS